MSKLPRTPERPPATRPGDPRYWDERDLEHELRRTFQICHECRMCVNYCGSFPELFARVDRDIDAGRAEGAEHLDAGDFAAVERECWQCKLCYIKCPYTADEGASELLDFPRLMGRHKAVMAARDGIAVVDRVLGEPQVVGALGSGALSGVSNLVQRHQLLRKVQERALGVSAEFPLPPFAAQSFPTWLAKHTPARSAGEAGEVVLFATCYGNFNTPSVPRAAVRVLEHIGYRVRSVEETCCGMPNLDGGDVGRFADKVRLNVAALLPHVEAGLPIVVPAPTCSYTMKREWAEHVDEPEVRAVASATVDLMEFLEQRRRAGELPSEGGTSLGVVAYHAPCHLRAQKVGFPGARVLGKALPETDVRVIEACSAVDGTWGMKAEHYETGRRYAQRLVAEVDRAHADVVVSDCALSALRIQKENEREVIHPVEALARAFGLDDGA